MGKGISLSFEVRAAFERCAVQVVDMQSHDNQISMTLKPDQYLINLLYLVSQVSWACRIVQQMKERRRVVTCFEARYGAAADEREEEGRRVV